MNLRLHHCLMLRYAITPGDFGSCFGNAPRQAPGDASLNAFSAPKPRNPLLLRQALLDQVSRLATEQVDFIQLREKNLPPADLAGLARSMLSILKKSASPTRLLLNTRIDIAAATGCHGVHLTSATGGETPGDVRAVFASMRLPVPIVSKACHTLSAMESALDLEVDLVLFSPIFAKAENPRVGLEAPQSAAALAYPTPVLALGGVTPENTAACLAAGARGVAGIRLFLP